MVRRFIKTGIIFLLSGIVVGGWLLARRELRGTYAAPHEVSAHTHLVAVGFVIEMIMGVALWLFPRPSADDRQYQPRLVALSWWMVTSGTVMRAVGELVRMHTRHDTVIAAVLGGGAMQVIGIGVFFYTMWTRIRALGSRTREAQGERF